MVLTHTLRCSPAPRRTCSDRTRRALTLLGATLLSALLTACSVNPTTGRSQFNVLSMSQEIAMGEEAKSQLTQEYGGSVPNPQLNQYMTSIGNALAAQTEGDFPNLPWEFTLLDSDVINAFALPGGKVFMSRGLAQKFTTEAELAAVLGHEIGHVTARHSGQRVSQSLLVSGLVVGAGVAAGQSDSDLAKIGVPLLVGAGGQGYLLKFNRSQELEADALGVRYMVKNGYDPVGARMVQEVLAREGGAAGQPEFLSTHPYPDSRIDQINKLLKGEYSYTQGNPDFSLHQQRYESQFLSRLSSSHRDTERQPGNDLEQMAEGRYAAAELQSQLASRLGNVSRAPASPTPGRLMINAAALHQGPSWCAHCAWSAPEPSLGQ